MCPLLDSWFKKLSTLYVQVFLGAVLHKRLKHLRCLVQFSFFFFQFILQSYRRNLWLVPNSFSINEHDRKAKLSQNQLEQEDSVL